MSATLVTDENVARALERVSKWPNWTYDLETTGLDPSRKDVLIGAAIEGYDADSHDNYSFYFPFRHREGNIDRKHLPTIMQMLSMKTVVRTWNGGFDAKFSWNEGAKRELPIRDEMLNHHLLDENKGKHGQYQLKGVAEQQFGPQATVAERHLDYMLASMLTDKGGMWRLHAKDVSPYACADVELTRAMGEVHSPKLAAENLESVAQSVGEYTRVVAGMEHRGILIDRKLLEERIVQAKRDINAMFMEAFNMARRKIMINSPQEVCKWLGISSSADEILERMGDDPRVKLVQRFRKVRTAHNNYYRKFLNMAPDDVLHAAMLLFIVISGRMAVRDPPLQSLPRDTDSYAVKESMIARPGYTLVQADYKRAEMCIAAHYGNDTNMIALLKSGVNVHKAVSEELGMSYDHAKRTNFSIVYGIGSDTLSQRLNIAVHIAENYLKRYHSRYPGFKRLYYAAQEYADKHGHIVMYTGRRRHYNRGPMTPTHKASSNLIQGCVAELMREAQTNVDHELYQEDVHQLLQVHDAGVMEVPTSELPRLLPQIKEIMEDKVRFKVPMLVDIKYGPNLANTTDYKEVA